MAHLDERERNRALLQGGGLLLFVLAVPFVRFVLHTLITLVHELGHAAAGWLFGYPSIPAFDFVYGGGVTAHDERQWALVLLMLAAAGWAIWRLRTRRRALLLVCGATAAYLLCVATWLHEALIVFLGHGSELLFAGIFLYRGLSGSAVRIAVERPLYVMLGGFIVIEDLRFCWGLLHDPSARSAYENAKGGGHWMDFSVLAEQHLQVELSTVAGLFALCCVATPLLAWGFYRKRDAIAEAWNRTWVGEATAASPGR